MYSICNVVLGYEIPQKVQEFIDNDEAFLDQPRGFSYFYSGSGSDPLYAGIVIGGFSEGNSVSKAKLLELLTPTPEQIQQARESLNKTKFDFKLYLDEEYYQEDVDGTQIFLSEDEKKELIDSLPIEPEIFIMWGNS